MLYRIVDIFLYSSVVNKTMSTMTEISIHVKNRLVYWILTFKSYYTHLYNKLHVDNIETNVLIHGIVVCYSWSILEVTYNSTLYYHLNVQWIEHWTRFSILVIKQLLLNLYLTLIVYRWNNHFGAASLPSGIGCPCSMPTARMGLGTPILQINLHKCPMWLYI